MVEKLHQYIGPLGRFHEWKDDAKERWTDWKERNPNGIGGSIKDYFAGRNGAIGVDDNNYGQYSHIYRRKTRAELVRVSAAVMGIEFSYAAETAFVSPTLLKIGVEHRHMTLVWALSPLVGFFVTPVLGSLSDRCQSGFGRRRPFICLMSLGVLIGLLLVPNGEDIGYALGDPYNDPVNATATGYPSVGFRTTTFSRKSDSIVDNDVDDNKNWNETFKENDNFNLDKATAAAEVPTNSHPWGVFFTILGTVLLDFDADACQSPARAYLLDVTVPDDHALGLSTFTIMAGLGGFLGYALGGIDWDSTAIGIFFGGHVRAVFSLITIIFVFCVTYTITSFKEMPLYLLENINVPMTMGHVQKNGQKPDKECTEDTEIVVNGKSEGYGSTESGPSVQSKENPAQYAPTASDSCYANQACDEPEFYQQRLSLSPPPNASLLLYLKSIVYMPPSLRILCLTNLFCWMAHVCYSLYFTDFVGESVFNGDPMAPIGSESYELYENGVRFGCWGMSMYSLSCACYSFVIERLINRFRAKNVYICGLLIYSTGMMLMAFLKHKVSVILFSWTAGVMYSTLFTMPYLLVAHYHAKGTFELAENGEPKISTQTRGLGTDIALVSSMVFLAQFLLSMFMGSIVTWSGTTTAVVSVASALAFFAAISASQIMYLDL